MNMCLVIFKRKCLPLEMFKTIKEKFKYIQLKIHEDNDV